ncbi:MAG TPA: translocation/assembly module TamB domain-containing protein [Chitinophagaceae bacterium]
MQSDWGQNWLATKVTAKLSRDLRNRISIKHLEVGFFNKMNLEGVLVEDRKRDTLLYAGLVQVRITDWFFLKNKAELKYIGLQDAIINFNRRDSVWNYQFLQDYFASPSTGQKKQSGIEFDLKRVVMNNVAFRQKDAWVGLDRFIRVDALDLDSRELSITNKTINISNLDLVGPVFQEFSYTGLRPKKPAKPKPEHPDGAQAWNPENWKVLINSLTIKNGRFKLDQKTLTPSWAHFDGQHLDFSQIGANIKNFRLTGDTLTARVDLTTRERSGLYVRQLRADYRLHPQLMEFDDLLLKTNRSSLNDYFAMQFEDMSAMSNFIHEVNMHATFHNSTLASDDIAFFAPDVKNWNKVFVIDGKIRGKVDALAGDNVTVRAGRNTALSGDFNIVGLPNVNETYINVEASELRTNYADAVTFVPALRKVTTPNLRKLQYIRFTGTYTGFINDFVTYGTVETALGTLTSDLNMKLPKNGEPVYSGSISTNNFRLGQFINNSQLGDIAFDGDVKGRGFHWNTLDMQIDGTVRRIRYGNYTYQNITANGRLNRRTFDGDFVIKDPNADLSLSGLITFSGPQPAFDVEADIVKANLQALQLTKEDLSLSGQFNLNLKGSNLSNILGTARISNATLLQGGRRLSFDSLNVYSSVVNGVRTFRASSNEFDATIRGQFDLATLPDAFTLFLSRYYPSYIRPPRRHLPNQAFTFDITTGMVEDYIRLVERRLSGFNNSHISGSLNVANSSLELDANVPAFAFANYSFSDVEVKGNGNFERLLLNGQVNNAVVSDSLVFPQTTFSIEAQNDVSNINIQTTANQTINKADISAQVRTFSNGATVLFNPSSFVLNGKTWSIEQGGELDFRKNTVVQGSLVLRESNQEIRVSTHPSDIGSWNDLNISLVNLNIGDLSPLFVKKERIEGVLTGQITVEDPQSRFNVIANNLRLDQLRVDNDSIGSVQASLFYNNNTGLLTGNGSNIDPESQIRFDLALDFKDTANLHRDRISVIPVNYPVKILERFIGTLFSDLQGYVTGRLDILGEGTNRDYVGKGRLRDAGLKVNFTQVFYRIDDTDITLTENSIDFGTAKLRDREGNTATLRGSISHNSFQDMVFDIVAEVDSKPMELLNTNFNDNQMFYGRAKGTGSFVLIGPQYDMNMYIEARASETDSSFITLPPSRSRETGAADFMVERKYGREMTREEYRGSTSNMTYEVNLTANPMVLVEVVLDELTGDIIRGRGVGNLRLRAGTSEPLSIRGRYDIQEGNYLFTFRSFFKKPFELQTTSNNFIEWTGDPYDARINIDAVYRAENVSFAPLVSSMSLTQINPRLRGDVNVVAMLQGELFRPAISFRLEFPESNAVQASPEFAFALQQIEKNTAEINKQVTNLVIFNSFAPYEGSSPGYSPFSEFAYNTISGLFFGEVNKRLNQLLSKILRNNDLSFNFTGSLYNRNFINPDNKGFQVPNQGNLNFSVGAPLLNERVEVTFGGTFDVPIESDINERVRLFPDVNVEIKLNQSGTIRATFFYTAAPDFLSVGSDISQRAGAKVSYRKEFDSLTEVFFGRQKGKLKDSIATRAVIPPTDSTRRDTSSADN